MHQIQISDITIAVEKKTIKNLHLRVYPPDGRVKITVPLNTDDAAIDSFAVDNLEWIRTQQVRFQRSEQLSRREFVSGETHYFFGESYRLNVIESAIRPRVAIRGNSIDLYVHPGSDRGQREKVLLHWYRGELKKRIPPLIEKWTRVVGVEVKDWGVKRMRTKWGTCNTRDGRIWINLDLARKDPGCLEYVILHEIVHLLERLHNDRFHAFLDRFMPDWRVWQENLNSIGES